MAKIKYMGASHVHTLEKGDNFGGLLSEGLSSDVVFNRENSWVVDSDEAGLSEDAVAILVKSGDFKDVTGKSRIPTNLHQQIFLAMPKSEGSDEVEEEPVAASDDDDTENENDTDPDKTKTGTGGAGSATTAGGSTRRTRGAGA